MDLLQVKGNTIINSRNEPVRLRGFGVGGWMNSENFINGYPGFESGLRASLAEELGAGKAQFLWNRMLDYFLSEDDIAFMKQLGATVVRLPLNYRHFETDDEPFQYQEQGFARLDQVLNWCAKHDLYAIPDMHAVQGWQDPDWHSDSFGRIALIWHDRLMQDRFVALWEEFSRRYKDNPVIAGYNIMNEPVTGAPHGFFGFPYKSDWDALNRLNRRTVSAIRKIDPKHIIFLEGDCFSSLLSGLEPPFADNLVYSSHNYIKPCFGPGRYPGRFNDMDWHRDSMNANLLNHEGPQYARRYNVPLWIGEFGGAFDGAKDELTFRHQALDDQIGLFEEHGFHWTIWTYKDVGMMGTVLVNPESDYLRTVAPAINAKLALATDAWIGHRPKTEVQAKTQELGKTILSQLPDLGANPDRFCFYLEQTLLASYVGAYLHPLWARCFKGMSESEIDRVMQSFALRNCLINHGQKDILTKHMKGT